MLCNTYSANAPGLPYARVAVSAFVQMLVLPFRHMLHFPQGTVGLVTTFCPTVRVGSG
ncbi:hypothetical protein AGMMS49983_14290 [Clostridia bacterium]|nr:hypothetical protein AGMMS49983_14290 [Clostridia bacterium]